MCFSAMTIMVVVVDLLAKVLAGDESSNSNNVNVIDNKIIRPESYLIPRQVVYTATVNSLLDVKEFRKRFNKLSLNLVLKT